MVLSRYATVTVLYFNFFMTGTVHVGTINTVYTIYMYIVHWCTCTCINIVHVLVQSVFQLEIFDKGNSLHKGSVA